MNLLISMDASEYAQPSDDVLVLAARLLEGVNSRLYMELARLIEGDIGNTVPGGESECLLLHVRSGTKV